VAGQPRMLLKHYLRGHHGVMAADLGKVFQLHAKRWPHDCCRF